jgi:hypothetical protein
MHELLKRQAPNFKVLADVGDLRCIRFELFHRDGDTAFNRRPGNNERVRVLPALEQLLLLDVLLEGVRSQRPDSFSNLSALRKSSTPTSATFR